MILTAEQVFEATKALNSIAENERVIPALARFKLARMYDMLEPIVRPLEAKRMTLVQKYGGKKTNPANPAQEIWGLWPEDANFPLYLEEWKKIADESVGEVAIKPITMTMLGEDPKGVQLQEMIWLGQLLEE